jgi:hypothetical protein
LSSAYLANFAKENRNPTVFCGIVETNIRPCAQERVGLSKGGVVVNKKSIIRSGELIRSKTSKTTANIDFNISILGFKMVK